MGAPERLREDPPLISKLEGLSEKEKTLLQETVKLWLNFAQSVIFQEGLKRIKAENPQA